MRKVILRGRTRQHRRLGRVHVWIHTVRCFSFSRGSGCGFCRLDFRRCGGRGVRRRHRFVLQRHVCARDFDDLTRAFHRAEFILQLDIRPTIEAVLERRVVENLAPQVPLARVQSHAFNQSQLFGMTERPILTLRRAVFRIAPELRTGLHERAPLVFQVDATPAMEVRRQLSVVQDAAPGTAVVGISLDPHDQGRDFMRTILTTRA